MINIKNNLDVADKVIINYLVKTDADYELYDEMNNPLDRYKILRLINSNYFINPIPREIFTIIKSYYKDHARIPRVREIIEKAELDFYDISEETIKVYFDLNLPEYAPDFVHKYLRAFVIRGQLDYRLTTVAAKLKTEQVDVDNIEGMFDFVKEQFSSIDLEFTDSSKGLDVSDPRSHIQVDVSKKSTGFAFLDKVLGGWEPKTLTVFQGRPKVGKSLILGNVAVRGAQQGLNAMVVTVELGDKKYVKRLGANLYDIPKHAYDMFISDDDIPVIAAYINKKKEKHPEYGNIFVKEYPTEGVSVMEIENYIVEFEKQNNIKFDLVVVDYINLLKSSKLDDGSMYKKIKDIAQELRKIAQRNKWAVVTATQVKQAYFNSDDLDMGSGAESSALVATVDALFGLISPLSAQSELPIEGSEVIFRSNMIKFKTLANRDGGNMESWAFFDKDMKFFRLTETIGNGTTFYPDDVYNHDGTPKQPGTQLLNIHNANRMSSIPINIPNLNEKHEVPIKPQNLTSFDNSPAFIDGYNIQLKPNIISDETSNLRKEGKDHNSIEILQNMYDNAK